MRWLHASTNRRMSAWWFCALVWLVAAATVSQAVFPRNVVASYEADGEPSEEESDPTETTEELAQLCDSTATGTTRRQEVSSRRFLPSLAICGRGPSVHRHLSGEQAARNGMGGPLRC